MKIGLDVDGILADFNKGILDRAKRMGLRDEFPRTTNWITTWNYGSFDKVWKHVSHDIQFWMELEPYKNVLNEIDFTVSAYVTARPVDSIVTSSWLEKNGFPKADVYTVHHDQPKSAVLKDLGISVFVDDKIENFVEMNEAGDCGITLRCLLLDRPWNRLHNAGAFRIKSLREVSALVNPKPAA